jgi:uncharacterized protein YegJ (DUF2314 family)
MFKRFIDRMLGRGPGEFTIVPSGDAGVRAATAEARATLDIFWRKFDTGEADEYQLKVGLTTPNEATEHVWLAPSGWREGKVVGRLLSQPLDLPDVDAGDEVYVDPERISDWSYVKADKVWGAFTQRALLDQVSAEFRRQAEAAFSPTPLEPESH